VNDVNIMYLKKNIVPLDSNKKVKES